MTTHPSRRRLLFGFCAASAAACAAVPAPAHEDASPAALLALHRIEARVGGRLGVFALDLGSGRAITNRPDERFAMCSTFKWLLAAAVLRRIDQGRLSGNERLAYGPADLLEHAPVTREHLAEGSLPIAVLMRACVVTSDNTAANLLLACIGGPAALTHFVREEGDDLTRLDRDEPSMSNNDPGDPRDTTSPRTMVGLMRRILCGDALTPASRELLLDWMRACETGRDRLRAGLPQDWLVGDKTGSGGHSALNDVAIAVPPNRAPILIAVYMSEGTAWRQVLCAAQAELGRLVAHEL